MRRLKYILALLAIPRISSGTLFKIVKYFQDIENFFKESAYSLEILGFNAEQIKAIKNPSWGEVEKTLVWARKEGQCIISYEDAIFPILLKEISTPPYILYIKGNPNILNNLQIALVGCRNPTHLGAELARQFAIELVRYGFCITSGLAIGIDGASHQGAVDAKGATIAVLGTGLNEIYPKRHQQLADQIVESGGAIISEFPLDTRALPANFPRRNRIISGLATGVLVVEATLHSGSLITARLAAEQGREVFAIPHSIHNPLGKGCHYLIRQGAKIVESVVDIVEEIRPQLEVLENNPHISNIAEKLAPECIKLLECLEFEPVALEKLSERSGFSIDKLLALISEMELNQLVKRIHGGYQRVKK